jgi:hypothetical protein
VNALAERPSDRSVMTREQLRERVGRLVTLRQDAGGWLVHVADRFIDGYPRREAATKLRTEVVASIMSVLWPEGDA